MMRAAGPRSLHTARQLAPAASIHTRTQRQCHLRLLRVASQDSVSSASEASSDILQAFFYGRAFALTLNKRLGEFAVDVFSEVSKAIAERPQRVQEFQEEVQALARQEMEAAGALPAAAASMVKSSTAARISGKEIEDPQAVVDDLRAEVAYARALIQQIKDSQQPSSV